MQAKLQGEILWFFKPFGAVDQNFRLFSKNAKNIKIEALHVIEILSGQKLVTRHHPYGF